MSLSNLFVVGVAVPVNWKRVLCWRGCCDVVCYKKYVSVVLLRSLLLAAECCRCAVGVLLL